MTDANKYFFPISKKAILSMFSAVTIVSAVVAGTSYVNAATPDNKKISFSEDLVWMRSEASLTGDTLKIDFSNRFSPYLKQGPIHLEATSNKNVVSVSNDGLTLNLVVKGFGDSIINVTATDQEGNAITDQFSLKVNIKGDLNGDGIITPADALLIYQVTSGKLLLTEEQLKLLDIDGDGKVTNNDATLLMSNYVGKKPSSTLDNNYFIILSEVNDAPKANKDHYSVKEDQTLTVDADSSILKNDIDVEGDTLTATKVSDPAHGTLTLNSDGTFTYVPKADFNGKDRFTYKANDGQFDSEETTVTIDVEAVNDAPIAHAGSLEVTEDEVASGKLSATDVDGDTLTYILVEDGKKGAVTITDIHTGTYTYTPKLNENGKDSFRFKVNDGTVDSEVVTVEVTIKPVNDAPTANDDHYFVKEDETLTVDADSSILKNDIDVDGDALTAKKVSDPAHGTLTLNSDGTFTYVPEADFNGQDQFTYKANDGQLDSEETTVTIEVEAVNDTPIAHAGSLEVIEDEVASGKLSATDVDGDTLTYILVEDGKKGSVTITDMHTGTFTYTPKLNENGKDSFRFKVNDGTVDSEVVTVEVTIKPVNDAPTANDDHYFVKEDETLTVDADSSILKNDIDVDGDVLTAKKVSDPAHGTLTLNSDGTFTYVPKADFNGQDQFTYKANDGQLDSEETTVTIDVEAVNDTPIAHAGSLEVTEDEVASGKLSATDVDGDTLTYILVEDGKKGAVTITDKHTGTFTYTPKLNENGKDSFSFKVNDGTVDSEIATVEVNIAAVNDAPSVSEVKITGKLIPGETVEGTYTYFDVENDPEGTSEYQWYRGTQQDGSDKAAISGATSKAYTIQDEDKDYYLFFEVRPVAATGEQTNQAFLSSASEKVSMGEATLSATSWEPLTEESLRHETGGFLSLELSGDKFKEELSAADFVLNNAPTGLKIVDVYYLGESSAGLLFEYDGTDFDLDIPDFSVTAKASATIKGKAITSNPLEIKASMDAPSAYISEYLDGGDGRSALEIYYPGNGVPNHNETGLELEVHLWQNGKEKVIKNSISKVIPGVPFIIIDSIFYDAFDIMNIWYFNEDTELARPGNVLSALVLKKDGKVIDTLGDPSSNQPIIESKGIVVRNFGIKDGTPKYEKTQWKLHTENYFQLFNHYPH